MPARVGELLADSVAGRIERVAHCVAQAVGNGGQAAGGIVFEEDLRALGEGSAADQEQQDEGEGVSLRAPQPFVRIVASALPVFFCVIRFVLLPIRGTKRKRTKRRKQLFMPRQ